MHIILGLLFIPVKLCSKYFRGPITQGPLKSFHPPIRVPLVREWSKVVSWRGILVLVKAGNIWCDGLKSEFYEGLFGQQSAPFLTSFNSNMPLHCNNGNNCWRRQSSQGEDGVIAGGWRPSHWAAIVYGMLVFRTLIQKWQRIVSGSSLWVNTIPRLPKHTVERGCI